MNEAAEIIHGVAHPDANIIFGTVIDDEMGDEVRITVIAAGFDRWTMPASRPVDRRRRGDAATPTRDHANSSAATTTTIRSPTSTTTTTSTSRRS